MNEKIKRNSDRHYELGDYEATHHSKRKYGSEFNGWIVNHKRDRYDYSDTLKSKKEAMDDMRKRHHDSSKVDEEIANVSAGIPGTGQTPAGKPANFGDPIVNPGASKRWKAINAATSGGMFRRKKPNMVAEETFAGSVVFEVNSKLFHNLTLAKRKGKHWRTYLEEDDCYAEIREWATKHPKGKIIVRNECTGEMRYVRYN